MNVKIFNKSYVLQASYASGSKQLVWAIVSVDMLSQICVYSYISHILCIPSIVSGIFVVLVYVISVTMKVYMVSYRDGCYLLNRWWNIFIILY
jgi:hypothetical protein